MVERNPVVVTSTYRVMPGRLPTFSVSAKHLLGAASRAPGYLGGELVRSPSDASIWQVVCRFETLAGANAWEASQPNNLRTAVLERFARRVDAPSPVVSLENAPPPPGPAPAAPKPVPPPRWKMAVVTLIAVFPAVLTTNLTVIPRLTGLSLVPRTFVLCVIVTILMTFFLIPRLTKLLAPWLNADPAHTDPAHTDLMPAVPPTRHMAPASHRFAGSPRKAAASAGRPRAGRGADGRPYPRRPGA